MVAMSPKMMWRIEREDLTLLRELAMSTSAMMLVMMPVVKESCLDAW